MNAFTAALLILIAASTLWIAATTRAETPKPVLKAMPQRAVLVISCEERDRVCRARNRMEKVKELQR